MNITDQIKFLELERIKLMNEAEKAPIHAAKDCFIDKANKFSQVIETLNEVVAFFQSLDSLTIMANRKKS